VNEKTIADAELDVDAQLILAHEFDEYNHASEEVKAEAREFTSQQLKIGVGLYLHQHKGDAEALFNLLRGVTKLADFKEQGCGVIYINGEFATNFYTGMPSKEERKKERAKDENVNYAGEVIHISYNTFADEEEIENMEQEM
jgi:hypothetical protein